MPRRMLLTTILLTTIASLPACTDRIVDASSETALSTSPAISMAVVDAAAIAIGQTLQLSIPFRERLRSRSTATSWRSLEPNVVSVSSAGLATGLANGTGLIAGAYSASVDTFRVRVGTGETPLSIQPSLANIAVGASTQLSVTGTALPVSFTSSNAAVVAVSPTGLATAIAVGTSTITARNLAGITVTATVSVAGSPAPPPGPVTGAANPLALPASNFQIPNWTAYPGRNLPAGQSYIDPSSGARVWKATDASTPFANSVGTHDYGTGANQISREWGQGKHTILVRLNSGDYRLVDFTRGQGFTNWRGLAAQPNMDLSFTFSSVAGEERIAYMLTGGYRLIRYNTATNQVENTGNFPKDFQATAAALGQQAFFAWLQQDRLDSTFVMINFQQGANLTIAWDSKRNEIKTHIMDADEFHLDRDGRYVFLTGQPYIMWDLLTNAKTAFSAGKLVHPAAARGYFVASNPDLNSAPQRMFNMAAPLGGFIDIYTSPDVSMDNQHRAGQWIQTDGELGGNLRNQWMLHSAFGDGSLQLYGSWNRDAGEIVWGQIDWQPAYRNKWLNGVPYVAQFSSSDNNDLQLSLRAVQSKASLTEGTFFFDGASEKLFVWPFGGATNASRIYFRAPSRTGDAISFISLSGAAPRLVAHTYHIWRIGVDYWSLPFGTISPDGKLVMFNSNMGSYTGRSDLFVVEVPLR